MVRLEWRLRPEIRGDLEVVVGRRRLHWLAGAAWGPHRTPSRQYLPKPEVLLHIRVGLDEPSKVVQPRLGI